MEGRICRGESSRRKSQIPLPWTWSVHGQTKEQAPVLRLTHLFLLPSLLAGEGRGFKNRDPFWQHSLPRPDNKRGHSSEFFASLPFFLSWLLKPTHLNSQHQDALGRHGHPGREAALLTPLSEDSAVHSLLLACRPCWGPALCPDLDALHAENSSVRNHIGAFISDVLSPRLYPVSVTYL